MFGAEGFDEFDVLGFGAGFDEDAEVCLALVEGFSTFTETASQPVVYESVFQDLLDGKF